MLKGIKISCCILFGVLLAAISAMTNACSRFTYNGPDNTVTTGRSMDWMEDLQTDIWAFPVGTNELAITRPIVLNGQLNTGV